MRIVMGLSAAFFLGIVATVIFQWSVPASSAAVQLPDLRRRTSRIPAATSGSEVSRSTWSLRNRMRRFYEGPDRG
jgi:hypothetical protein